MPETAAALPEAAAGLPEAAAVADYTCNDLSNLVATITYNEPMTKPDLQRIAVVLNPTAGSDTAAAYCDQLVTTLGDVFPSSDITVLRTTNASDPEAFGASVAADLIVSISGDGTVHGLLQGLMRRDAGERPAITVIPVGSGNDIARSFAISPEPVSAIKALTNSDFVYCDLGKIVVAGTTACLPTDASEPASAPASAPTEIPANTPVEAPTAASQGAPVCAPIGALVSAPVNAPISAPVKTIYYMQTLSFGVDAAVALKTVELRKKTRQKESLLYARAAVDAILTELHANQMEFEIDGIAYNKQLLIMAVQNGRTYGGGFLIAPDAKMDDGMLDIVTADKMSSAKALYCLSQIKVGKHGRIKGFNCYRASTINIRTGKIIPVQADGEQLSGREFKISVAKAAIRFLAPSVATKQYS